MSRGSSRRGTRVGGWVAAAAAAAFTWPGIAGADVLSGVVRTLDGAPVAGADFDVFTLEGVLLPSDDNSDADGTYRLDLPPGRYDLVCEPSIPSGLAPRVRRGMRVEGEVRLDWSLAPSHRVIGRVLGPSGAVAGADLDFDRADDGTRQPALGDITSLFGTFAAFVEEGDYHMTVFPPAATGLAPARTGAFSVPAAETLRVELVPAAHLSGTVRDELGGPVEGVRLAFNDAVTGERIPASGNRTAVGGTFTAGVVPGQYALVVAPPAASRLVPQRIAPIDLGADLARDFILERGVVLRGTVTGRDGRPLAGADWDIADEATGTSVPSADDNTDYDGRYALVLHAGVYRMTLSPPAGSGLGTLEFSNVAVLSDTTLDVAYASSGPPPARVRVAPAPNPAVRRGEFVVELPGDGPIRVEIADVTGRIVRRWTEPGAAAGARRFRWDGRDDAGRSRGAGVYFLRVRRGGEVGVARWVLLP